MCVTPIRSSNEGSAGKKLEGDVRDIVFLQVQTSSYFQLRKKFNCIEFIDKSETQIKNSPYNQKI